jgi:hypothetical protein
MHSAGHGIRHSEKDYCIWVNILVKLSCPCAQLIKHYAMKTYGGSGGIAPPFLTSTLDGDEWSASRPCRFTLRERAPVPIGWEAA